MGGEKAGGWGGVWVSSPKDDGCTSREGISAIRLAKSGYQNLITGVFEGLLSAYDQSHPSFLLRLWKGGGWLSSTARDEGAPQKNSPHLPDNWRCFRKKRLVLVLGVWELRSILVLMKEKGSYPGWISCTIIGIFFPLSPL